MLRWGCATGRSSRRAGLRNSQYRYGSVGRGCGRCRRIRTEPKCFRRRHSRTNRSSRRRPRPSRSAELKSGIFARIRMAAGARATTGYSRPPISARIASGGDSLTPLLPITTPSHELTPPRRGLRRKDWAIACRSPWANHSRGSPATYSMSSAVSLAGLSAMDKQPFC